MAFAVRRITSAARDTSRIGGANSNDPQRSQRDFATCGDLRTTTSRASGASTPWGSSDSKGWPLSSSYSSSSVSSWFPSMSARRMMSSRSRSAAVLLSCTSAPTVDWNRSAISASATSSTA